MSIRFARPEPEGWLAVAVPAILAVVLIGSLACLLLYRSVREADMVVIKRDHGFAAAILQQDLERIAHDQESVTAWDDAVLHMRAELDADWLDDNVGLWMNMYFGHERIIVLDQADRPVYASLGSKRVEPEQYDVLAPLLKPMLADLRRTMLGGHWTSPNNLTRSPGAEDLAIVDGHPAVVSIKPIVPSTSKIVQEPDQAYMHVVVHYLDGTFLSNLEQRYLFDGARFAWSNDAQNGQQSFALRDRKGAAIGYLIWNMHLPGQVLLGRMIPVLAVILCIILGVVAALVTRLRQGAEALRVSEAKARHLAFHDVLTGLANRACFNERLAELCSTPKGRTAALMLLDLDHFKQINDTLGHQAGDDLIRQVGARLTACLPAKAMAARLGGDEFAVLLPAATRFEAGQLCDALVRTLGRSFPLGNAEGRIGASIGVAFLTDDCGRAEDLTRRADVALYRAKHNGRGKAVFHGEDQCSDIVQPLAA